MVFLFHAKCQVDKMTHLDKKKIKTNGNRRRDYFCDYSTLPFQTPFYIMGLSVVADHPDPINYCMTSNLGYKTNKKQHKDMEIRWKQQYDIKKTQDLGQRLRNYAGSRKERKEHNGGLKIKQRKYSSVSIDSQ